MRALPPDLRAAPGASALLLGILLFSLPPPASAQAVYKGVKQCTKCHTSLAEKAWTEFHKPAEAQLNDPKAAGYAAAVGGNARDKRCLECHAPVHGPAAGISCETCHGPSGGPTGYFAPHSKPEFYTQPDFKGLRDLYGDTKASAISQVCIVCHVLDPTKDKAIAEKNHPTGADFDVGRKLEKMKHWPSNDIDDGGGPLSRKRAYAAAFYAKVSAAGRPEFQRRLAGLGVKPATGGAAAAPAATTAAPAAAVAAAPKPGTPPAAAGAARPAPAARPAATGSAVDPFFAEKVPEYVPGSLSTAEDTPAAPERPAVILPQPVRARPVTPAAPLASSAAPAPPAAATPAPAPTPATPGKPADDIELRGQAAILLQALVKSQAGQLELSRPKPAPVFKGPGSELRRLQDEVLALALDTLRRPE